MDTRFDRVRLRSARLELRPLGPADAQALLVIHADADVMRYSNMPPWTALDQAHAMIERDLKDMPAGRHLCLGIEPLNGGEVIGTCTLYGLVPSSRRAEIGFVLGRPAWGQGFMREALGAMLDHAFGAMNLNRVEADTDPRNDASMRTLERLGFKREGFLPERWIVGGEMSDSVLYGLLGRHWRVDAR
jgi:[ribosomal protein S5]-alanine N-acetyltransferase